MRKRAAPFLALLTDVCADAARVRLPRPKRGFQMRMGKFTIPAAREREVCEFRTLPNRKPIDAQEFEFEMTPGSHHDEMCFIVGYYYRDDESVPPPPVPSCLLQTSGLLCSATTVP
jgi:hypothetical protein